MRIVKRIWWVLIPVFLLSLTGCDIQSKDNLFDPDNAVTPIETGTWFSKVLIKDGKVTPDNKYELRLSSLTYLAKDRHITDKDKEVGLQFFPIPESTYHVAVYKLDSTSGSELTYVLVKIENDNTVFSYPTSCPKDTATGDIYDINIGSGSECWANNRDKLISQLQKIIEDTPMKPNMIYQLGE